MAQATDRRFFISGVRWSTYEALLADVGDRAIRLSYDGESLELMSPGPYHERSKWRFGRMIEILTDELDIPIEPCGSTTLKKVVLEKGLEPDEAFYILNEARVRGKREIDFNVDPPPDLAVEIDITRSSVDRQGIYAAFGVPEVWRYDGTTLRISRLGEDGAYEDVASSPSFPFLPLEEFAEFGEPKPGEGHSAWAKRFRAWVRERVAPLYRAWLAGPGAG